MRIFIDENIPFMTVKELREMGTVVAQDQVQSAWCADVHIVKLSRYFITDTAILV